jgi:hypothetical protein
MSRPLYQIASDIKALYRKAGKPVYFAAAPYLDAMESLNSVSDSYGCDSGKSIVLYALGNLQSLRGPEAKALKAELKQAAGVK